MPNQDCGEAMVNAANFGVREHCFGTFRPKFPLGVSEGWRRKNAAQLGGDVARSGGDRT